MLTDALTRLTGMTESTNAVQFLMDRFDEKFALKIFLRGKDCEKSEKEFKHEMEMNILALLVNGGNDPFLVLAVEMGCGPLPLILSSGKKVIEYNYILTR